MLACRTALTTIGESQLGSILSCPSPCRRSKIAQGPPACGQTACEVLAKLDLGQTFEAGRRKQVRPLPAPPLPQQVVQAAIVEVQFIWHAPLWGVSGHVLLPKSLHALCGCRNEHTTNGVIPVRCQSARALRYEIPAKSDGRTTPIVGRVLKCR